jgi:hypothetical protein
MAMIHVARGGANIGSFPIEEIREGLRTGRFLPTDMAWEEGMPDWRPLSTVMAGKPDPAIPATDPAGASVVSVSPASSTGEPGAGLPWEHRQTLGLVKAFIDTISMVLTKPAEAFGMMKTEGGLFEPLLYALIGGSIGTIISLLFRIGVQSMGFMADRQTALFGTGVGIIGMIFFIPILLICGAFVWSGLVHLCLMMMGGAKKPFEATFRVICFSQGSTGPLAIIPFCGGFVAAIYNIVLQCMGLARAHEIEVSKAVMAVLLPIIVCCGGGMLLALLGGFSALSLFSGH